MSGERIHLSIDDETATILEEMEEHLKNNFGGKSAFFRTMVKDYSEEGAAKAQVKAIKRKIRKKEKDLEYLQKELKLWENQLEEEKKENKAENIEEEIERLKAEKDGLQQEIKSEEQLRQRAKTNYKERAEKNNWSEEKAQKAVDDFVERKMRRNQDKRDKIQKLENQINELQNKEVEV